MLVFSYFAHANPEGLAVDATKLSLSSVVQISQSFSLTFIVNDSVLMYTFSVKGEL